MDAIAVLNAGSSSIKFSLFVESDGELALSARGQAEGLFTSPRFVAKDAAGQVLGERSWGDGVRLGHDGALDHLVSFLRTNLSQHRLVAVGHRVVHGGLEYAEPLRVDATVLAALEKYVPLAPLHQPHNLAPIRALLERAPELPQVACFDTAFHRGQPAVAQAFALPKAITERGVRRYGFHGLSYEYIAHALPSYDARAARGSTVVLHLGNGASMCAIADGKSVASTMGFTAADGLPMGTRCGNLDPGVVLYLMDELEMDARAIEKLIYQQSGLLGVSGISSDMRTLEASTEPRGEVGHRSLRLPDRARAGLARGSARRPRCHRVHRRHRRAQHAVCASACARDAAWLGVELDRTANAGDGPRISARGEPQSAWVVPTNEELMIARHTRRVLASPLRRTTTMTDGHSPPRAQGTQGARRRHRERALDRMGLREGVPRAGRKLAITYVNEKTKTYVEPLREGARCADLHAARRGRARATRGGVRRGRSQMGRARHPRPLDRIRAEGRPAGRASRLLGRGFRSRWTSPVIRLCGWRGSPCR